MKRLLGLLAFTAIVAFGQLSFTNSVMRGTVVPGSCTITAQIFIDTDATVGQNAYICNGATFDQYTGTGGMGAGDAAATVSVAYSATPTFTANANTVNVFTMTLTGNVTSCTIASATTGQVMVLKLTQDATGGRTFACTGFTGLGSLDTTANAVCAQPFVATSSTVAQAVGGMVCNSAYTIVLTSGGNVTATLPTGTYTLVGADTAQTLTNKTYDTAGTGNSFSINGTAITAVLGNTAKVQLAGAGTPATDDCAKFDANDNLVTYGAACGGGSDLADANTTYLIDEFDKYLNSSAEWVGSTGFRINYGNTNPGTTPYLGGVAGRYSIATIATVAASASNDGALWKQYVTYAASDVTGGSGSIWTYWIDVEATTTVKYRFGLSSGLGGGSAWPGTYHAAMIEFDSTAGDTNWMCVTAVGGTPTRTSIGVAPNPGTYQKLTITASSASQVTCGVNGTTVNVTATLPTADMTEVLWVGNTTTTSRYFKVDREQVKYITTGR